MKKVIGYVSVKREHRNHPYHKFVMDSFQMVCDQNEWELVKVYEDVCSSPKEPRIAQIQMHNDLARRNDIDILLLYAFGKLIVMDNSGGMKRKKVPK
ncbi:hypothetical protein [Brevibacillus sp. AY1]|uniref:hypothetical protein n=1 Tax=Brevibacillus sp. AY1 TaxID=2807621 RepID=UPI002453C870|nr:hypothetical protein [Brevibacillus sp. AY1]MDH4619301.1 hypothetical protein [Brevibacillus sp. AY1]